ncbi:MAG: LemA family protein [Nanoarchaeota archaeon]|nr:LemA family protein [Nanoarchaeota archaeon]
MKKLIVAGAILAIIVIVIGIVAGGLFLWFMETKNQLVASDEGVNTAWGNVQSAYQRRADLIPNLAKTVKASAEFEKSLQTEVTAARAGIAKASTPAELEQSGGALDRAINVVFENYPEIKSTENFLSLQDELSGSENRIKVERDNYNKAVMGYNIKVRSFPSSIVAGWSNMKEKQYFGASAGSENAPDVGELLN